MGPLLHGGARTAAAVRRALQPRQTCLAKLADRDDGLPTPGAQWQQRSYVQAAPRGAEAALRHRAEPGRRGEAGHMSPADPAATGGRPVCRAGHASAPDPLGIAPWPSAADHQPLARLRGRQAAAEPVHALAARRLPQRYGRRADRGRPALRGGRQCPHVAVRCCRAARRGHHAGGGTGPAPSQRCCA
jgi:hypothetical protein